MKKVILFLSLFFLLGVSCTHVAAQDLSYQMKLDTAKCSTSADTIDWIIPRPMHSAGQFEYAAIADSLSGATGGSLVIYTAPEYSSNINNWYPDATYTINGVQTKVQLQDRIYHKRIWIRIIFPSSTQQTKVRQWFTFKPDK